MHENHLVQTPSHLIQRRRVIIMGAAGRDFHDFNVFYRDNPEYDVVAFTATQISTSGGTPGNLLGGSMPL